MRFSYGVWESIPLSTKSVLTFGNFDGVHLGHQTILKMLKQQAVKLSLPTTVLLFEPQPREYFQHKNIIRLSSLRDKVVRLKNLGIDFVYCLKFNTSLATCSAEDFIHKILFERLQAEYILIGEDARFGLNRTGNANLLHQEAKKTKKTVEIVTNFSLNAMRISSTVIRQALLDGKFKEAAKYLGKPYSVIARVAYGQGLGRNIGVPTLNLHVRNNYPPLTGVFAVHIVEINGNISSAGIANWGFRPTVCGQKLILEVHGFQLTGNLYGRWVEIIFLKKIRDEKKFSSFSSLVQQIKADIYTAKKYFKEGYDRL